MTIAPLLRVRGVSKAFPGVQALEGVDLDVAAGTVHALMGENGAGKSTLARILAGLAEPDAGTLEWKGRPVRLRHPHDALRLGVAMIHQELLPFPELSVAENILMGREPVRGPAGWIDRRAMHAEAERLLARLGAPLPPARRMKDLSVAEMQAVEIAKALAHRAEVIVMDEPTSALSAHEAEALFGVVGELKRQGAAILYISHKFEEVFRLADTVTVLRDGRLVGTHPAGALDPGRLIALMVGRELAPSGRGAPAETGDVVLSVRGLARRGRFEGVSFDVRRGEVLGIAGLMGAGRTDVLHALFGLAPADAGEILVRGSPVRIGSPRDALAHGLALVSEDRKRLGLVSTMSVRDNITLSSLRQYCRGPFIDPARDRGAADRAIREFGIRTPHRDRRVGTLSGGNQQKVVIARALLAEPDILLLDEPTRGIDVAAKAEVHAMIAGLARRGKAVVLVSSELPEVLALSDRLLVMRGGAVSAELDPRGATQEDVMRCAVPA
jgi:inositol transport system ATP-binding protein